MKKEKVAKQSPRGPHPGKTAGRAEWLDSIVQKGQGKPADSPARAGSPATKTAKPQQQMNMDLSFDLKGKADGLGAKKKDAAAASKGELMAAKAPRQAGPR